MPAKRCTTCHEMRDLSEFNLRRAAPDGRQARCRSCSRQWYERNKAEHQANVLRRNRRVRAEAKQRLGAYLLAHPCVDCGETDLRVLEFDHTGRVPKRAEVTRMAASGHPWSRILEEIAACEVRCANCHRRVTSERAQDWRARFVRAQQEGFDPAGRLERLLR